MIYQPPARIYHWYRPRRILFGLLFILGLLIWFLMMVAGLGMVLGAMALMALTGIAAWRWPAVTAAFFLAFLPINRFAFVLLLDWTHVDLIVKAAELWKEGLIAILLVRGLHDAFISSRPRRIVYLDLMIGAYLILTVAYLFYPGPGNILDPLTRFQGWRTDASFLFAYFAGRGLVVNRSQLRLVVLAALPGCVAVGAVALWQIAAPAQANHFFQSVGAITFSALSGDTVSTTVRDRSIPGLSLSRAGSLMLGDLALAFYQLLTVPVAAALYFLARRRWPIPALAFLLLMVGTLALTVTRSAILALPLMLILAAVLSGRWLRSLPFLALGLLGVALAVQVSGLRLELLPRLWDFSEGSTQVHLAFLQNSFDVIRGMPWGHGLGTGGTIGSRYLGDLAIDNENWTLLLATDMGVIPALIFLAVNVTVVLVAIRAYLEVHDLWLRVITLTVACAGVGYLFVGNFLHSWENLVVSMGYWLLAGIAVNAARLQQDPGYESESESAS